MFRFAIGPCSCEGVGQMNGASKVACEQISTKLEHFRKLSFSEIAELPSTEMNKINVSGLDFEITTYIDRRRDAILVVAQVFHATWKWPTYIGITAVGKIFVEGFVITNQGEIQKAPDNLLWEYR